MGRKGEEAGRPCNYKVELVTRPSHNTACVTKPEQRDNSLVSRGGDGRYMSQRVSQYSGKTLFNHQYQVFTEDPEIVDG